MSKKFLFFFIIFFILGAKVFSFEIKTLALVNNLPITNYDVILEIKTKEILNNKKINIDKEYQITLEYLINQKIKELEIKKNNIDVTEQSNKHLNKVLMSLPNKNLKNDIKNNLLNKIKIDIGWKKLIYLKFYNKLNINMSEIKYFIENKNLSKEEVDKFIDIQKNKKIEIISNNFLKSIKNKHYIEKFK